MCFTFSSGFVHCYLSHIFVYVCVENRLKTNRANDFVFSCINLCLYRNNPCTFCTSIITIVHKFSINTQAQEITKEKNDFFVFFQAHCLPNSRVTIAIRDSDRLDFMTIAYAFFTPPPPPPVLLLFLLLKYSSRYFKDYLHSSKFFFQMERLLRSNEP